MTKIKKRPDGRYVVTGTYDGKRKYFLGKTIAEVKKKKYDFEQSREAKKYTSDMFLRDWADSWLEHKKPEIEQTTYEHYESALRVHIKPCLGHYRLSELTPPYIRDFITELSESKAPRTVLHIYRCLKEMLTQALNDDLLLRHPMRGVKAPKQEAVRAWVALTEEEAKRLVAAFDNPKHQMIVKLAIATGFRRSELLGLRVEDVNLEQNTVSIRQTVKKINGVAKICSTTKTKQSKRTVSLPAGFSAEVRQLIRANRLNAMKDPLWQDNGLLFPAEHGEPFHPDYISELVRDTGKAANMPKGFTINSLRHTHASLLLAKGVNYKVVQQRLGHSTAKLTLDTYSHIMPGQDQEAANLLANII